jgi:hypothetical protein
MKYYNIAYTVGVFAAANALAVLVFFSIFPSGLSQLGQLVRIGIVNGIGIVGGLLAIATRPGATLRSRGAWILHLDDTGRLTFIQDPSGPISGSSSTLGGLA